MKITQTNSNDLNAILSIEILKEDYLPKVNKAIATAKNNAVIKGFRKGFVPDAVIKKMYGNSILLEELNKLISEVLNNHIETNKIDMLGRPLPVAEDNITFNINNPIDFTFKYEIGLAPNLEINSLNKKTVIVKDLIIIDENSLESELVKLAARYGNVLNPEDALLEEDDIVTVDLVEVEDKKVKENGITHTAVFNMNDINDEKIKKAFFKLKIGDEINIKPYDIFDNSNDYVTKSILGLRDGKPSNLSDTFKATITKVSRVEKAALDQELFDKIYGPGAVNSLEEFKQKMKNELEGFSVSSANNKFKETLYTTLLEKTDIQLPDAFLKKFIKSSNEKPISEEQIETEYPAFVKGLKWNLITAKIAKDNNIKIEMDDIKEFSKNALRQQLMAYNPTGQGLPEETIEQLNNSVMAKEEHVKKSYDGAMEQKLFAFIEDQITIEEKTVTFDTFFNKKEK